MCNTFSFGNNIEWKNYFKVKLESTFNDYLNNSFKKRCWRRFYEEVIRRLVGQFIDYAVRFFIILAMLYACLKCFGLAEKPE